MKEIIWSNDAGEEFIHIIEYTIERFSAKVAEETYSRVSRKLEKLLILPNAGRIVPELKQIGLSTYREIIENPWRIIYRIDGETIFIVSIIDSRRNVEELLYKKIIEDKM